MGEIVVDSKIRSNGWDPNLRTLKRRVDAILKRSNHLSAFFHNVTNATCNHPKKNKRSGVTVDKMSDTIVNEKQSAKI